MLFDRRYQLLERVGSGGMAAIYAAFDQLTNETVALKKPWPSAATRLEQPVADHMRREYDLLATLDHPNIIPVYDFGIAEDGTPYYTMPLFHGVKTITEYCTNDPLPLLVQLVGALVEIHRLGVVHGDIKPENVLVQNGNVFVIDLGFARPVGVKQEEPPSGTLAFMAPEVIYGEAPTPQADLYAVGMIAYTLYAGGYPFSYAAADEEALVRAIICDTVDVWLTSISLQMAAVLDQLLAKNPADRYPSAYALLDVLLPMMVNAA